MSQVAVRQRSWLWLQGLLCGAAISFATAPAILLGVLLAPGLLARAFERTPSKPMSETMLILGLATTFAPLRSLWESGHTIEAALDLLSDPARLAMSWGAAATGWVISEFAQVITRQVYEAKARHRIAQLQRERDDLAADWGLPNPKQTPPPG